MANLYIDGLSAPDAIKGQLKGLAKDIAFSREATKGGNSYLYFGTNRILGTEVAVKFYYWGGDSRFHAEPTALAALNSRYLLPVHNAGLLDGEWAYFITPYCPNGDIDDVLEISPIGNIEAIDRTCHVLSGLGVLHENRYVHRDLKPANIYVGAEFESIIGDFGSIKRIPEGRDFIPASSHAILYRPPESVETSSYGFEGDIYQCGLVLFQLLGGSLPYDEVAWLNRHELRTYRATSNEVDRTIYADQCIKAKILRGRIVDVSTLPPWVPDVLKRTIRKAVNIDPARRFPSVSAFHANLNNNRSRVLDWRVTAGEPHLITQKQFKVCQEGRRYYVKKSKTGDHWRRDNTYTGQTLPELIDEVSERQ